MATTKIWPVKGRIDHLVDYVLNSEKTEHRLYATGINCTPGSATAEMNATKRLHGKVGGTVAFHAYQSFDPGEVTPETAHEIGTRLAHELWGDRFQIVVTTHVDKGHVHNHFAVNSVSYADGRRFHCDAREYRRLRAKSDRLCAEHGLSVIQDPKHGKAKHHAEWNAEREGRPTWRAIVKQDVDEAVDKATTDKQFYANLKAIGYEVKLGKDISVRPPGKERFVRLARNFGDEYTYEGIARRILARKPVQPPIAKAKATTQPRKMPPAPKGSVAALYRHYLYLFGFYEQHGDPNKRMHFLLAEDLRSFDNIVVESKLLDEHGIVTDADLLAHMDGLDGEIKALCIERKAIRAQLRKAGVSKPDAPPDPRVTQINKQLKTLRREVRHCANIAKRSGVLVAKIAEMERHQAERKKDKEAKKDGRIGTSGRADRAHDTRR
ncbi:relaxase/mobilization nuclease domain-containing protein [Eggerthella timonensis]|uniref:relaxase/mobilization nuclease domain-containing protein n=1 Tax=Eggerthella timonensis TaxID=1871008 RepID=UPI000C7833D6|nr:relaxase/mobilization nuclease domain-containing protein [Eggerthella timonensis]